MSASFIHSSTGKSRLSSSGCCVYGTVNSGYDIQYVLILYLLPGSIYKIFMPQGQPQWVSWIVPWMSERGLAKYEVPTT